MADVEAKRRTNLGDCLRLQRSLRDLTLRDLGAEIGISAATLMRIEQGRGMDADTMLKVMGWLMRNSP